ncbi:MAG: hypothetical protein ACI9UR_001424 [Bacteroidia bacterium]
MFKLTGLKYKFSNYEGTAFVLVMDDVLFYASDSYVFFSSSLNSLKACLHVAFTKLNTLPTFSILDFAFDSISATEESDLMQSF